MRNQFRTKFWRDALQSLPAAIRHRHVLHMRAAERWELALGEAVEALSRAKKALARLFQTPRHAAR
jgi:hypothetical protein